MRLGSLSLLCVAVFRKKIQLQIMFEVRNRPKVCNDNTSVSRAYRTNLLWYALVDLTPFNLEDEQSGKGESLDCIEK